MGFIYKITNQINQKSYIGLTTSSIEERWREHLQVVNKFKNQRPLYSAIAKYGVNNFTIEKLEEVDNDFLAEREIYWINYFNTYQKGYNATLGGDGVWTKKIQQYTLEGNLIKTFENITQAALETNISKSSLRQCCQKQIKTLKGFIFKYEDDVTPIGTLIKKAKENNCYKNKVYQYGLDGSLIAVWNSIKEATERTHISNISRALNASKPSNDFVWRSEGYSFFDNLDLTSIIVQLSLDNEILAYYSSFLSAAKALGKKQSSAISESCRNIGYHKTAYGYKWRYLKDVLGQL